MPRTLRSHTMPGILDQILGLSLKSEQLGFWHMAARAFLMYFLLIAIVRAGKKRFLGRSTAFDVILVILIGSIAARALTGGAPYFPSVLAIVTLVAMHWLFSLMSRSSASFSEVIKGTSTPLIRDGQVNMGHLRAAHMSLDDLQEDLRLEGVGKVSEIEEARLERSGRLSVIKKER
jgi:uncharacterized membrane protein YcaP (DUF421 family)